MPGLMVGLAEDHDAEHDQEIKMAKDAELVNLNQRFGIDCLMSRINAHPECDTVVLGQGRLRIKKRGVAWAWVPIPGAAKKQRLGDVEGFGQTIMDAAMQFLDGEAEQADNDQDEVIQAVVHAEG